MVSTHQNNNNNNVNISNNFNSQNIPNLKSEAPSANSTSTNAEQSKPTVNDSMNDTDKLVDEFEKVFHFFNDYQHLM
jgi:FMN-dependent NADH-azoreductase